MKNILTSIGEWCSLGILIAVVVIATIAFVSTCHGATDQFILARITSPFGEHYMAIPSHFAKADLHKWEKCWSNDELQAIKYKGFAIIGYLIMDAKVPVIKALVITGAGGPEYYIYERGKPFAVGMETFMTLIGFQHFMHEVQEDAL